MTDHAKNRALDWTEKELESLSQITPADIAAAQVYGRTMPAPGAGGLDDPGNLADADPDE